MKKESRKLQELIGLAMRVNVETNYCVFVRFSGHVNVIDIDVRESKEHYQNDVVSGSFYTDRSNSENRYRNMRNALLEILETGEFDPDSDHVTEEARTVYDYKF